MERIHIWVFILCACLVALGCGASGGGASSGTSDGAGYAIELSMQQADMPVSSEKDRYSTQSAMVRVYGPVDSSGRRPFAPDGTRVVFTCSAGGFLVQNESGEDELVGSVSVDTSGGMAQAVYAAPASAAVARIQASAAGAHAWVDVNVYSGLVD